MAQDAAFRTPLVNGTTDSTAYTATATLPADTAVFWQVRANDGLGTGLRLVGGSDIQATPPVPGLAGRTPGEGRQIPLLQWGPVQGAVAYDIHVEQLGGTTKDFTRKSTASPRLSTTGRASGLGWCARGSRRRARRRSPVAIPHRAASCVTSTLPRVSKR